MSKKYQNGISGFLTIVYILSLATAIFHYHNINLSNNREIVSVENDFSKHFQIIFDSNYECLVQHNLLNIQTSLVGIFTEQEPIQLEQICFRNCQCEFYSNQVILNDNLLRAPPAIS